MFQLPYLQNMGNANTYLIGLFWARDETWKALSIVLQPHSKRSSNARHCYYCCHTLNCGLWALKKASETFFLLNTWVTTDDNGAGSAGSGNDDMTHWVSGCFYLHRVPELHTLTVCGSWHKHSYPCFIDEETEGKRGEWVHANAAQSTDRWQELWYPGLWILNPGLFFSVPCFHAGRQRHLHISHQQSKYAFLSRSNSFARQ